MTYILPLYPQVAVVVTEPDSEEVEISIHPIEPQVQPESGKAEAWFKIHNAITSDTIVRL